MGVLIFSESAIMSTERCAEKTAIRLAGLPGSLPAEDDDRADGAEGTRLATQTLERCSELNCDQEY